MGGVRKPQGYLVRSETKICYHGGKSVSCCKADITWAN